MNKKVLILYTSIGMGHKYIAQNIAYHLEQGGYVVKLHDVHLLQAGWLVSFGTKLHAFINSKLPFVWQWLYNSELVNKIVIPRRVPLAGKNSFHVKQLIDDFHPDAVITTQTTASAIVAFLKQINSFHGKFVVAFSDFHLHKQWLYDEADLYIANIEDQKEEMEKLGVQPEKIAVCGITLKPLHPTDVESVKSKLGIRAGEKVIVLTSGSQGIGFTPRRVQEFANQLSREIPNSRLIVVCGKNQALKQELDRLNLPQTMVLGFYEPFSDIYAIADAFLTKPGGLTISEILQAGVEPIVTHWLPGQEELNYHYLVARGLISEKPEQDTAVAWVKKVQAILSAQSRGETSNSQAITQKNHEGEVLLEAINALFHGV